MNNLDTYNRTLERIEKLELTWLDANNVIMAIRLNTLFNQLKNCEIGISEANDKYLEYLFIDQKSI
jgi:hypothetical protein